MQEHGEVLSCRVLCHPSGVSKCVGFVQMRYRRDALNAISSLHGIQVISTGAHREQQHHCAWEPDVKPVVVHLMPEFHFTPLHSYASRCSCHEYVHACICIGSSAYDRIFQKSPRYHKQR